MKKLVAFSAFTLALIHLAVYNAEVYAGNPINNSETLDASAYHEMRGSFQNSLIRFEEKERVQVAFLGGSITYNPGWRDSVYNYLGERFPETEFNFIKAGIPSMGSTPSAFRLERDVLANGRIDLLFVEAAVNDATNGRTRGEQLRAMEGIIQHVRVANPDIDIVMMHFVDPDKMREYRSGHEPDVIRNHNQVAEHYQIPTINLAKEVTDRIDHGEFTWEDDFINLHPSPFGQGVYAHSIIEFLDHAYAVPMVDKSQLTPHVLPGKLVENCYDKGYLLEITSAHEGGDWYMDTNWNPNDGTGVRPGFVDVPMLICANAGDALELEFEGRAIGIVVASGQDAGIIEYRIDKQPWQSLNLFTPWSSQLHLPWYYTLAWELDSKSHLLEIRVSENRDDRSTGNACRIRNFYMNRN